MDARNANQRRVAVPPVYRPFETAKALQASGHRPHVPPPYRPARPAVRVATPAALLAPAIQRLQAGTELTRAKKSPPSTGKTQKWAKGILVYTEEEDTRKVEFGAHSGSYT